MEAIPRLPMLSFELRSSTEKVDFSTKIKQYIINHYNEDPVLYASAITSIDSLRKEAITPGKSISSCSTMKRYYCQLHLMASRFPMKEHEPAAVSFSWKSLHSNSKITLNDISLEMASILYNIGALHSQLGAADSRTSAEGMKMSCTHFQCAAWAFQHINEEYSLISRAIGLSPVLMSFLCHLCLAQAQECILEKSIMDNRKSAITAKVGIQVVDYYKQSLGLLTEWPLSEDAPSEITNLKIYKNWNKYVLFKIAYYESISLLFQGQQSEDQQKMGERVTFYQAAFGKLEEARKLYVGVDNTENVVEALNFLQDVIEAKRKVAKSENEFIYHETVPNLSQLPIIKGASLVKGISFSINDPEVCGPDLFSSIVPMQAHEYASMYSEEKAKLLRKINGLIETKNEELETFLSMLDLNEICSKLDGNKLPQDLIDKCAALSAKPDTIQNLTDAMNKLSDVYQDVGSMLAEIKELLEKEENHEKEYQLMLGKRPPSIAATDLTRESKKYQEAHAKASESNQTLHKAMVMHIPNLKLLSLPLKELINHIPSISEGPEVEALSKEMQHLMSKIDEMKEQRLVLASQLRDLICADDITRQVITYTGDKIEELFEQELKKYNKYTNLIEKNLSAQENILKAFKETYARYGSTRKNTGESFKKRTSIIASLTSSYDAYEDLIAKSSKGLEFYKKLEMNVSKLLQRVKGTCKVQDEEREQMMKTYKKTETSLPQEEGSSTGMKLKDYLNIKKETGKLSLDHSTAIPQVNPYLNDPNVSQTPWIPGIRPAPVGSEETDAAFKGLTDSFHGFYQNQEKDRVWNNSFYSAPQNADQKLKYFLPPSTSANSYLNYNQNSSFTSNQDTYPISSYSTVLPKLEGHGLYEPKSNYYNVHGSPNRCYNPNQQCRPSTATPPSTNINSSVISEPIIFGSNTNEIPYYGYPNQTSNTYPDPQKSCLNFNQQPEAITNFGSPQTFENKSDTPGTFNSQLSQTHSPFPSNSGSSSYSMNVLPQSQPQATYNSYVSDQTPVYGSMTCDQTPSLNNTYTGTYSGAYSSLPVATAANYFQQEQIPSYDISRNYQTPANANNFNNSMDARISDNYTSNLYKVNPANVGLDCQQNNVPVQYLPYMDNSSGTLQNSYGPQQNSQYLQSGNESVYTASQTPAQYVITNSDVYKTSDIHEGNYQGTQYYNNQYGAYGVQSDHNIINGNAATYMQAGVEKQQAVTTITFTNSETKSSPVTNSSNVDLLAGLDIDVNQLPLIPETASTDEKKKECLDSQNKIKNESKTVIETETEPSVKLNLRKDLNSKENYFKKENITSKENIINFVQDVEKYEKFVEGLTMKTLNGPTSLDLKWKEITDLQEKISPLHIISVARCYPMKNRFSDILPYDDSRVELPSTKDDYINASRMTELTNLTPNFILTQAPLPSTYADFWAMVFEQQVEIIVCLLSDFELNGHCYWPIERGQELEMGKLKISLQSSNSRSYWVERTLSIYTNDTKTTRVVIHLQFTAWPGSSFPETPNPFIVFSEECISFFSQQRSMVHPIVVHCTSGVGRTGLFCLVIASILDIRAGREISDLSFLAGKMCHFRKNCLRDREHLKFAYQSVLQYCRNLLMKHGISTNRSIQDESKNADAINKTRGTPENLSEVSEINSDFSNNQNKVVLSEKDTKDNNSDPKNDASEVNVPSSSAACTSTGRTSPSNSDCVFGLDLHNLSLKEKSVNKRMNKFSSENSSKGLEKETNDPGSVDPLSLLDSLWTIKKEK